MRRMMVIYLLIFSACILIIMAAYIALNNRYHEKAVSVRALVVSVDKPAEGVVGDFKYSVDIRWQYEGVKGSEKLYIKLPPSRETLNMGDEMTITINGSKPSKRLNPPNVICIIIWGIVSVVLLNLVSLIRVAPYNAMKKWIACVVMTVAVTAIACVAMSIPLPLVFDLHELL